MKNCNEITRNLLERRDRYMAEQQQKKKKRMLIAIPLCFLCLAALVSFGLWQAGIFAPGPEDVLAAGDWNDPNSILCGTYWVPEGNQGAEDSTDSSAPSEGESTADIGESIDWTALNGQVTVDGVTYIQFDAGSASYTPDVCLGSAGDFKGTYQSMGITAKLFTTREDPDVLLVHLPDSSFAALGKEGK